MGEHHLPDHHGLDVPTISSRRLELVSMSPAVLTALLDGRRDEASRLIGASVPAWWPEAADARFLRLRLDDLRRDPGAEPFLLRALVRRAAAPEMVGYVGFHVPEDPGRLELGYLIFPRFQGRGYATEAVRALMDWARETHGITRFVASVAPGNEASLAVVRRLGFVHAGEQWDDEDGLELVFELDAAP
jgi:[ribosomal protein S5]-alanine N-acetyltransferase